MLTVRSTINISSQSVPPIIPVVQGDTGRAILFTLADFTIPAGASATYYVQKPSGEAVYNNATIDGNNVLVNLTAQSIIEKGDNYGQVRIAVGADIVTSFDFILLVKEFRGIDATQSLTEMNIFDKAVEQAADAIDEVKTDALDDIGDAKDAALEEINQSTGNFADAFSASTTYAAGDYVMHSGQLYRFTANHATGAWTGSDAEAVTVGEELTDLKEDFVYYRDYVSESHPATQNILPPVYESGRYVYATGEKITDPDYVRTPDAVALPDGCTYIRFITDENFSFGVDVCFYSGTNTNTWVGSGTISSPVANTAYGLNVPSGGKYIRIYLLHPKFDHLCVYDSSDNTFYPYEVAYTIKTSVLPESVVSNAENGNTAYNKFSEVATSHNLLPPDQENGYFTGSVGQTLTKVSSSNHVRTVQPVPFSSFTGEYKLILKNAISGGGYVQIFFLASDKKTIVFTASFDAGTGTSQLGYVPDTAEYFMIWASKGSSDFKISDICVSKTNIDSYEAYQTALLTDDYINHDKISSVLDESKNIVIFGDSIFGMIDNETGVANIIRGFTNANIVNCAFGGTRLTIRSDDNGYDRFDFGNLVNCVVSNDYSSLTSASGMPSYFTKRITRLSQVDFTKVDIAILAYGTNDYASGVNETGIVNCGNYIKTLQSAFPQIKTILLTPYYRVFFDENNQFETDSNSYNPGGGTLADYVTYFAHLASSINVPLIDCYNIGINVANYARYFTAPDGTHHNANGRSFLGEYLGKRLLIE